MSDKPVRMTVRGVKVWAHIVIVDMHCSACQSRARLQHDGVAAWSQAHRMPHVDSVPVAVQCVGAGCPRC